MRRFIGRNLRVCKGFLDKSDEAGLFAQEVAETDGQRTVITATIGIIAAAGLAFCGFGAGGMKPWAGLADFGGPFGPLLGRPAPLAPLAIYQFVLWIFLFFGGLGWGGGVLDHASL
jgi:hypothetical protein